ncbi:carbohydrate ABC transporter permease [Robinsoniella peoriensis]
MNIKNIPVKVLKLIVNVVFMLFSISCIFPILWMVNSALKTSNEFMQDSISLTQSLYVQNFIDAVQSSGFLNCFLNSALLGVINVVLTVVCALVTGYFISRYNFRFKKAIYLLFVSGMVIPMLSLLIPVFLQFKTLGMLDKPWTLTLPYLAFSMPFAVMLTENYIRSIPVELDEAAYMEGCSTFHLLSRIVFPMCSPTVAILIITSFMNAWNEFPFALVLLNNEKLRTISIGIRMFNSEHNINYPLYMAALLVSILPILIIYLIFSKQIMKGMTVGAVKG